MDEVLIFQRLSQQERVILSAMDYLEGGDEDTSTSDSDSDSDN